MENERKSSLISVIIATILIFLFYFQASIWSENGKFTNILLYIMGTIIFFLALVIVDILLYKTKKVYEVNNQIKIVCSYLLIAFGGVLFYRSYKMETENWPYYPTSYLRHNMPELIYLLVLAGSVVIAIILFTNKLKGRKKWLKIAFAGLTVLIQIWFMYAPNCFKDNNGGLYHIDAYTNSIINALSNTAHEQHTMAIYGHYSIFYTLPIKILQHLGLNQWTSVTLAIALFGGIVFAIEYWVISQLVENEFVFIVAVLGNSIVSTQIYYNQYYQMMPHRYLFQAIILAGVLLVYKATGGKRKFYKMLMWVLAGAAIVWNTETGLVSAVVWMLGNLYLDIQDAGRWSVKCIFKNILFLMASFVGAYIFVNIYNLTVGGNVITIETFLYPLGSKSYSIESLQCTLQEPWAGYFIVILVTLVAIGFYFWDILRIKLEINQLIVVLTAVMGYGVYTYYINRAVSSNASIATFTLILILAYVCDRGISLELYKISSIKNVAIRNVVVYFCTIIMVSMAISSVATFGITLTTKNVTTYETESLDQFIDQITDRIPKDTVAFGQGTAQLFSYMDKKTGIYMSDWEDIVENVVNQEAIDYLINILEENQYQYILVNENEAKYIPRNYRLIDQFEYNGYRFQLYERKSVVTYLIGDIVYFYGDKYNADKYIEYGMSGREEAFIWTEGNEVSFHFKIEEESANKMKCIIELANVFNGIQSVEILVNGINVFSNDVKVGENIEFEIGQINKGELNITMLLPNAISPKNLGQSEDPRILALAIQSLQIIPE